MDISAFTFQESKICVRIQAIAAAAAAAEERTPVHFCVVLDRSGSMADRGKIQNIVNSLKYILNIMSTDDYISIISFNEHATADVTCSAMTADNKIIATQKIGRIEAGGGTNLSDAILMANSCLASLPGHKQGILLLTDGLANQGVRDTEGILRITTSVLGNFPGTTLSCVGYGTDHNGELLRAIALEGGGSYNVVQNIEDVASVFGDILGSLVSCSLQQVTISIPEDVQQLTKYPETTGTSGSKMIRIGDLQSHGDATVIMNVPETTVVPSLTITGFDIRASAFVNTVVEVAPSASDEILKHAVTTLLRAEVASAIEKVRLAVVARLPPDMVIPLREELKTLQNTIGTQNADGANLVLCMLSEEIEGCIRTLNTPIRNSEDYRNTTQVMSQHAAYVGLQRGIRNTSTPHGTDDPVDSPYNNLFSNRLQRNISSGLSSAIHRPVHPDQGHLALISQLTPPPPPSLNPSISMSLPPPINHTVTRQVASPE